ncbi:MULTISPECIES: class I SAM-dependent methyltransferase [unclassified Photobacterium]|uniref:class I SAM-dependent methyltransferase n=1 Tax=unclassified Photobacterium TaxID=2628852 RepID=UPI000D168165|nr:MULTISPECIES: class I SAM-dependent methyltransferase [unclassified Photobacterium]PSV24800.1 2-polyprenyl-3-methyl-5-hydroxy-6-metoxy-1,4-benzoquinol methylase [Photobacterium sp. GB-56]PSV29362.1 2-polyprenyl-3-methyl-5-hydroxy-6-metoxy-1,4-benzoquinol methylase [Photobacterium sp. GB-72]PSV35232.1 2-polyprenyl-3-methyl-5-hydroxy-6-metoxy-1,4-benzoquinol methylase [Photobacterium sp. GB-27]PSV35659.1 2-polyprenyl-3-methyl-5-hydroxy-6-metoxy-1,4-benzoquinol methylase [Photobacterium sp. GB-
MQPCPLCHSEQHGVFVEDKNRCYFRCQQCALIFADPEAQLSPEQEKAVYDQHQNNPDDMGYRQFLGRLATPLVERLPAGPLDGLDFGSGPGPTLSIMLDEMGYNMAIYDPYFAPDPSVLTRQYDFVTCTEAIEHFNQPAKEWGLLLSMIKPGGWLGLMTKLATDAEAFTRWHYKNDPTHVSFFSRDTFRFLAQRDGLEVEFVGNDVILLRKTQ